jgi:hypothetical protein
MKPNFVLPATWMVAVLRIADKSPAAEARHSFAERIWVFAPGTLIRASGASIMNYQLSIINCPLLP